MLNKVDAYEGEVCGLQINDCGYIPIFPYIKHIKIADSILTIDIPDNINEKDVGEFERVFDKLIKEYQDCDVVFSGYIKGIGGRDFVCSGINQLVLNYIK